VASNKDAALGLGVYLPQTRPYFTISHSFGALPLTFGTRLNASYTSLKESFQQAAEQSDYADKISTSSASFFDVSLQIPEVSLWNSWPAFLSGSPVLRVSRVSASYTTKESEPLTYTGWGFAVGLNVAGGYRLNLGPTLSLDVTTEIQSPMWTSGSSDVVFARDNSTAVPTFTESELEHILESLQPYLQSITGRTTIGAGLRLVRKF